MFHENHPVSNKNAETRMKKSAFLLLEPNGFAIDRRHRIVLDCKLQVFRYLLYKIRMF